MQGEVTRIARHIARHKRGIGWHIFFHPDYDRRLWFRTRSADPGNHAVPGARGLVPVGLTAGGELHPALKTYCDAVDEDGMNRIVRRVQGR